MQGFSLIALAVISFFMLWQDLKTRAISWPLFPMLLFFLLVWSWQGSAQWMLSTLINCLFLTANLLLVTLWFAVKRIAPKTLLATYVGSGDLLLFGVMALSLPYYLFIPFQLLSLLVSAVLGLVYFKENTVPLAGLQSAMLVLVLAGLQVFSIRSEALEYFFL